jgi:hypothetical protein
MNNKTKDKFWYILFFGLGAYYICKFRNKEITLNDLLIKMEEFEKIWKERERIKDQEKERKLLQRIASRRSEHVNNGDYKSYFFVD